MVLGWSRQSSKRRELKSQKWDSALICDIARQYSADCSLRDNGERAARLSASIRCSPTRACLLKPLAASSTCRSTIVAP